jgi:uncharacterized protein (AIM24 family)
VVEIDTHESLANPGPLADAAQVVSVGAVDEQVLAGKLRRIGELVSAQRLPEAELELVDAQQVSPNDLRVLKLLALVRFKLGRLAEARQVYQQAAEVAVEDPAIRLNLGLIALKLDSFAEAARELEAAVHLRPDDRRAWSYLGYAYARNAQPAQAAPAFRRAGQHQLAAEMERAATSSSSHVEPAVVGEAPAPAAPISAAPMGADDRPVSPEAIGQVTPRPAFRSEGTPAPSLATKPVATSGEMPSLASFASERLLSLPQAEAPVSLLAQGILRFSAGPDTHVRESALLVALGESGLSLAHRRTRGHLSGRTFASEKDRFLRIEGSGELLLSCSGRDRSLIALSLDRDVLYIQEDRVVAWGDELVWEAGSVPGSGTALLQFRGTGRVVVLAGADELVALRIAEGDHFAVPTVRLAGWLGRVVVQGHPAGASESPAAGLQHVTCEGEGVLLLSRHGEHR